MPSTLEQIVALYNPAVPLAEAQTIPSIWYTSPELAELERRSVFRGWQMAGRTAQVRDPGQYIATDIAGEPIIVVRGEDGRLRAFYNVCRHHAAAVMTEPEGCAQHLRCPYHGWTYGLDGALKGMTDFEGVRNFDRAQNGLAPVLADVWEQFVFVCLNPGAGSLAENVRAIAPRVAPLNIGSLRFFARRRWVIDCNWKVYVDNYLDGGYHVPHMHKGLNSVLNYSQYTIEIEGNACIQSTPLRSTGESDSAAASTRRGDFGWYLWLYPNFMINWYSGVMDTNLVLPRGPDQCEVIFDYYFQDVGPAAEQFNLESVAVADRVQDEDIAICNFVQRGLRSSSYRAGRLSVRREAGEHLFHRLLHADLSRALSHPAASPLAAGS